MTTARIDRDDVMVTKLATGGYNLATVIHGYRVSKIYIGYSGRAAMAKFLHEVNAKFVKERES